MEAKVQASEVSVVPQPSSVTPSSPDLSSETSSASPPVSQAAATAFRASADPMEEFSRQLEDIISTYGSAASLMDKQTAVVEPAEEKVEDEPSDDVTVTKETGGAGNDKKKLIKGLGKEGTVLMQSLNKLRSHEEKLEALLNKYAELAEERRGDQRQLRLLQQKQTCVLREREQLQAEHSRGILARSKLESLCRELQRHNKTLKEDTLQRCRDDEEKRREITTHFQSTLVDIQAQIEQHSNRNAKLCQENANLADKLESLMNQYEQREEGLEKISKHRDLQVKLAEAKLEQANGLLVEAEDKHRREKEYLLREAIDKTKKCFAMKEQELAMKKKLLIQAAEWKLQAKQLKEQGTIMQAQLTLYSQKFDEFQVTLAKSNDIYASFKQEMEKMSKKMKKLEKESDVWKTRFESCNKALADMIAERTDKDKEFEIFVIKINKLELLCRALQEERKGLYEKIKEVRFSTGPSSISTTKASAAEEEATVPGEVAPSSCPLEPMEIQQLQDEDPVLTMDMSRLRAEQTRLQEFAASLLAPSAGSDEDDDSDSEEEGDVVTQAQSKTQIQVQKSSEPSAVPEQAQTNRASAESASVEMVPSKLVSEPVKVEEVQKPIVSTPATPVVAAPPQEEKTQPPCGSLPVKEAVKAEGKQQSTELKQAPAEVKTPVEVKGDQKPTPALPVQGKKSSEPSKTPKPVPAEVKAPVEVKGDQKPTPALPVQGKKSSEPSKTPKPVPAEVKAPVEVKGDQKPTPALPVQGKKSSEPSKTPKPVPAEVKAPVEVKGDQKPTPALPVQGKKSSEPSKMPKPVPAEVKAPVEVKKVQKPTPALPVQGEKSSEPSKTPQPVPAEVRAPVEAREVLTPPLVVPVEGEKVLKQSSQAATASKPTLTKSEAAAKPGSPHHLQQPTKAGSAKKQAPKKKSAKNAS